jgi:glutathione S-transferase
MYRLFGFYSQNTLKVLYVLEELGVDYDFSFVDLTKGEHKTEEFAKLSPIGKVPVLQIGSDALFESGAIVRYLANVENSDLYPAYKLTRAKVDQWIDYFSCHLGRWLSILFFEHIVKVKLMGTEADPANVEEAIGFSHQQLETLDGCLAGADYLTGDELTIADLFAFAYMEQVELYDFSLEKYANVTAWYKRLESLESITKARAKVAQ